MHFLLEACFIGICNIIISGMITYIFIGKVDYPMFFTFFLSGFIIHILFERIGMNKRYCKYGNACQ